MYPNPKMLRSVCSARLHLSQARSEQASQGIYDCNPNPRVSDPPTRPSRVTWKLKINLKFNHLMVKLGCYMDSTRCLHAFRHLGEPSTIIMKMGT